jgi:hypothetical protein
MPNLESLERTLARFQRQDLRVVEHRAPSELVSPVDLLRMDELGRTYVACPANTAPHSELKLTDEEGNSLVEPPPRSPRVI